MDRPHDVYEIGSFLPNSIDGLCVVHGHCNLDEIQLKSREPSIADAFPESENNAWVNAWVTSQHSSSSVKDNPRTYNENDF